MKKTILSVFILFSVCYSYSQTTQDEYNYCKKLYARAVTDGYELRKDVDMVLVRKKCH